MENLSVYFFCYQACTWLLKQQGGIFLSWAGNVGELMRTACIGAQCYNWRTPHLIPGTGKHERISYCGLSPLLVLPLKGEW